MARTGQTRGASGADQRNAKSLVSRRGRVSGPHTLNGWSAPRPNIRPPQGTDEPSGRSPARRVGRLARLEDEHLDLAMRRAFAVFREPAVERGTSFERPVGLGIGG